MKHMQRIVVTKMLAISMFMGSGVITPVQAANNVKPQVKHELVYGTFYDFESNKNSILVDDRSFPLAKDVIVKNSKGEVLSLRHLRTNMKLRMEVEYTLTEKKGYTKQVRGITIQ
jgi:hypothetical protein